jgi:hypothetical protein
METVAILAMFIAAGFLVGLTRGWNPLIPVAAAALVLFAYIGLLAWSFVWAAQCWDCSSGSDETRRISLYYVVIFAGIGTLGVIVSIAIGALLWPVMSSKGRRSR